MRSTIISLISAGNRHLEQINHVGKILDISTSATKYPQLTLITKVASMFEQVENQGLVLKLLYRSLI